VGCFSLNSRAIGLGGDTLELINYGGWREGGGRAWGLFESHGGGGVMGSMIEVRECVTPSKR